MKTLTRYILASSLALGALMISANAQDEDKFIDVEWRAKAADVSWTDDSAWSVIDRYNGWKESTKVFGAPISTSRVATNYDLAIITDTTVAAFMTTDTTTSTSFSTLGDSTLTIDTIYSDNYAINLRTNSKNYVGRLSLEGDYLLTKTANKSKNMIDDGSGKQVWDGTWTTVAHTTGTGTLYLRLNENSAEADQTLSKYLIFDQGSTVNSTEAIYVTGQTKDQSFVNINGSFSTGYKTSDTDPTIIRKEFTVSKASVTVGETGSLNVGRISVINNSVLTIDGTASVKATGLATDASNINIEKGSSLILNGAVDFQAVGSTTGVTVNGNLTLNNGGSLYIKGGYGNVNVNNGGVLRLNSGAGTFSASSSIRLAAGGRVIFDSAYAWKDGGDGSNMRTYSIWMSAGTTKTTTSAYLDVNAETYFRGICFGTNGTNRYGPILTITFGDSADAVLQMEYLSVKCDTVDGYLWNADAELRLVNFVNGKIRLDKGLRAATGDYFDDLSLISAEGFVEGSFRVEQWEDGYYYLVGDVVPEPSTIAAIFGICAIGLAVYRRKKN